MSTSAVPTNGPTWSYDNILGCLTHERLGSYLQAADGDLPTAFALYEWNMAASASVLSLTSMTEVVLRNAIDRELTAWAARKAPSKDWFDLAPLDPQGRNDIAKARHRATRRGQRPELHGKVIAELSLGFWRFLVEQRYLTTLWVPATHAAFPGGPTDLRTRQQAVRNRLQQLTFVRNRAAHHEPIYRRDLIKDLNAAIELATWVCPDAGAWTTATSTLAEVVRTKPTA